MENYEQLIIIYFVKLIKDNLKRHEYKNIENIMRGLKKDNGIM